MKITLILPVYNESQSLKEVYTRIKKICESEVKYSFEIIFVNDGSADDSSEMLFNISRYDKGIKVIELSRNFGQQAAFTAGYDMAEGDAVITMDSDLQDPPEIIPELIRHWEKGNEIIYARRKSRDDGFIKKISADLYYRLLEKFSDFKIPRNVGDFRLIDKKVLGELKRCREKFRYLRGMVAWFGFKYAFVDFDRENRKHGQTAYTWKRMLKLAFDGFTGFTMFPLKLGGYVGVLVLFASLILFIIGALDYIINHKIYPLSNWLLIIVFCFFGVQFILIWILGEYIGRINDQIKSRPLYVINKKINFDL